eukprot:gene6618-12156_t
MADFYVVAFKDLPSIEFDRVDPVRDNLQDYQDYDIRPAGNDLKVAVKMADERRKAAIVYDVKSQSSAYANEKCNPDKAEQLQAFAKKRL